MIQSIDYVAILPELILGGAALLVLIVDLFLSAERKWLAMPLSLFGVLGSLAATLTFVGNVGGEGRSTFCFPDDGGCSFVVDNFAILFKVIFLVSAVVVLLLSLNYFEEGRYYQGEYYFLLLVSFFGMLAIASSRDLIMLFIALELVSVPGFVIAGFRKTDTRSSESAIKFFLIGVLATAVMLYGMSLLYGLTGSLQLDGIARELARPNTRTPAAVAAVGFVITGFAFKVSAAPFHFWAPDTYQGAPVPVAAFLSVASKAAGFTGLMSICFIGLRPYADVWGPMLAVLAAITMTLGNLVAIQQRHMVRLLAYSSVAQAGYMLVPFGVAATAGADQIDAAFAATLSYIAIYGIMNLGVFACVIAVARRTPRNLVADYRGLVKTSPLMAVVLAFFLFCLAGAPPGVAGLFAKFVVFRAAVDGEILWLAIVMAVNTVIAAYYYLKLAFNLFAGIGEPAGEDALPPARVPAPVVAAIGVTAVAAVVLSVNPRPILDVTPKAVFAAAEAGNARP